MRNQFWVLCTLLFGTLCVQASFAAADDGRKDTISSGQRVFYASHSLMWYVPEPLGEMAAARGIESHQLLGVQRMGASTTLQHWQLPPNENHAKYVLATGNVDALVMSPIQFPDEGIENFVKLGLQYNPKMQFFVQISWGGGDIDNQDFPKGAWNAADRNKTPEQLATMNARNIEAGEAQVDALNKAYGNGKEVVFLIPTSQAVAELRSRIYRHEIPGVTDQGELFVDPAHPSAPLEALNAYLHYAVLYRQSPIGLPMLDLLKRADRSQWGANLNRTLQEIAWETATKYPFTGIQSTNSSENFGQFDLPNPGEIPSLEFVFTAYVDIGPALEFGAVPEGQRRVIPITGGTFKGPRIQGEIVPGGADWNLSRSDGATVVEASYFLRTDDGVVIRIANAGVGAPPIGLRFTTPRFEAPNGKYDWLNQSTFVGTLDVDWNREQPIRIRVFTVKLPVTP